MAIMRNCKIERIKINNLEEIAIGKTINGETIISHNDNKIATVVEGPMEEMSSIIRRKYDYFFLTKNTLAKIGGRGISENEYNNYLNSIKEKTN